MKLLSTLSAIVISGLFVLGSSNAIAQRVVHGPGVRHHVSRVYVAPRHHVVKTVGYRRAVPVRRGRAVPMARGRAVPMGRATRARGIGGTTRVYRVR
jgi:hypothetical protein